MAEADAHVEGRRPDEERNSLAAKFTGLPVAHMMPSARIAPDRLLESQVLPAAEQVEVAHGRVEVGPPEGHARGDPQAALQGDRVGRAPAGSEHRGDDILLAPDQ